MSTRGNTLGPGDEEQPTSQERDDEDDAEVEYWENNPPDETDDPDEEEMTSVERDDEDDAEVDYWENNPPDDDDDD